MICHRCQNIIEGEPQTVSVETGSGVSADIYICPKSCLPDNIRRDVARDDD
ncbi:hypothetical protein [Streptomyces sp. LaPpAH-108]|uniref:hypothetical protein n=1 Tax=Streptomyces sp. LaPpAH-108 TaxID=1155714 RepID=UPI0003729A42|nr:hypothetical protein [Streptomyces sp. LaPpAH-108]